MLSKVHMRLLTQTHTHTHTSNKRNQMPVGCSHCFSLVIFGIIIPQTDSTHNPCGQLGIARSVYFCVCVCVCVYPACNCSCVSNSSLSCKLMTEFRERDSNMDRCLTPFSPDLETTGQTHTHKHTQTHTWTLSLPPFLFWWL